MKCCESVGVAFRFFLVLCAAAGVTFSVLTMLSCEFFEFENGFALWFNDGLDDNNNTTNVTDTNATNVTDLEVQDLENNLLGIDGSIGMFYANLVNDECKLYPSEADFDNYMMTGQYCSVIAMGFGALGLFLLLAELLFCKLPCSKILMNLVFFGAYAAQALTFLVFGTEEFCNEKGRTCTLGLGAIYSMVAFSMYLITSCAVCCAPQEYEPVCCKKRHAKSDNDKEDPLPDLGGGVGTSSWSEPSVSMNHSSASWTDHTLLQSGRQMEDDPLSHWSTA